MLKKWVAALTTIVVLFVASPGWNKEVQAEPSEKGEAVRQWEVPLPVNIRLTETEKLYEAPNRQSKVSGSVAPQEVHVRGVLLPEQDVSVTSKSTLWVQIGTWLGDRWVEVPASELSTEEYLIHRHIALLQEEPLYSSPDGSSLTGEALAPQTVFAEAGLGIYYRIETMNGPRWIRSPGKSAVYNVKPDRTEVQLPTRTPFFVSPESNQTPSGELSPQTVTAFESTESGWYHIETWLGPMWLHPKLSLPDSIVQVDETATLRNKTLYLYPHAASNRLSHWAEISPAHIIERTGPWAHIEFGHYSGWVYETTSPESYSPPKEIKPTQVKAEVKEQPFANGNGWEDFPLSVRFHATGSNEIPVTANPEGLPLFDSGKPLQLEFSAVNRSDVDLALAEPLSVPLDIYKVDLSSSGEHISALVWSGFFTVEPKTFERVKPDEYIYPSIYSVVWDQRDSDGVLVPPGTYQAHVKPFVYSYKGSDGKLLTGEVRGGMRTNASFRLVAPE